MKIEIDHSDLDLISDKVMEKLKPMIDKINKKDTDHLLNKKQLAQYLEVSVKWIDGYKQLGLPYIPMKGHVRFRKNDIDKWLESVKVPAVNRIDRLLKEIKREQP